MKIIKIGLNPVIREKLFSQGDEFNRIIHENGSVIRETVFRLSVREYPDARIYDGVGLSDFTSDIFSVPMVERVQEAAEIDGVKAIFTCLYPINEDKPIQESLWTKEEMENEINELK